MIEPDWLVVLDGSDDGESRAPATIHSSLHGSTTAHHISADAVVGPDDLEDDSTVRVDEDDVARVVELDASASL